MISVTIPIFNEKDNLIILYQKVTAALNKLEQPWEVILVNDGSSDGSKEVLDELADLDKRLKVIHFRRNYGQTAAMMAGFDHASGDIIIPLDGDLQNDPADIPLLLEKLAEGFDVCSGWRKDRKDNAVKRNLPSRVANRVISMISGVHLHDYGCSLKAYKKDVIKDVKLYGEMHRFIPIYASWQGARVTEVPVAHHPRRFGKSKYGLERTVKVVLDLIVVKFLSHYATKPMYIFGGFGVLNLFIGFLSLLIALYLKFSHGTSLIQTPLPLLSVMTVITGMMCVLMGLLAEVMNRTYHESQALPIYSVKETKNTAANVIPATQKGSSLNRTDQHAVDIESGKKKVVNK